MSGHKSKHSKIAEGEVINNKKGYLSILNQYDIDAIIPASLESTGLKKHEDLIKTVVALSNSLQYLTDTLLYALFLKRMPYLSYFCYVLGFLALR